MFLDLVDSSGCCTRGPRSEFKLDCLIRGGASWRVGYLDGGRKEKGTALGGRIGKD